MSIVSVVPVGNKRIEFDGKYPNSLQSQKRQALSTPAFGLPWEIWEHISTFLTPVELLRWEATAKVIATYTDRTWRTIRQQNHCGFDWKACEKEEAKNKWNYVLTTALEVFVKQIAQFDNAQKLEFAEKLEARFGGLSKRFPSFGAFVSSNITRLKSDNPQAPQANSQNYAVRIPIMKLRRALKNECGGEILLQTLHELQANAPVKLIAEYMSCAMAYRATCTALLALWLLPNEALSQDFAMQKIVLDQSLEAYEKKDHRALELLVDHKLTQAAVEMLYNQGKRLPPILAKLAEYKPEEQETLLDQAITAYGDSVPLVTLIRAAEVKFGLGKWAEAEPLLDKAIIAYADCVTKDVLAQAAFVKLKLEKWAEAEPLLDKAIIAYENLIPNKLLLDAAFVKGMLGKWAEAEPLFDKAITAYADSAPKEALLNAAVMKLKLGKWAEAEPIFDKAITAYADCVTKYVLAQAAFVKFKLGKWAEAEPLLDKAIIAYGNLAPNKLLFDAAFVKGMLGKWAEAEPLFDKAIIAYGDSVPKEALLKVAEVKFGLRKWAEAEPLFDKAIIAYGNLVPDKLLLDAAFVKSMLEKWAEAEPLFDKAIIAYGDSAPKEALLNAAVMKFKLGKWAEAEPLFDKAITAYGDSAPKEALLDAAAVKGKLAKGSSNCANAG